MDERSALIEPHIPSLRRYARGLLRDASSGDDLLQDCLERALRNWSARRPEGDLRAWLFAIMHNLFVSGARLRGRRGPTASLGDLPEEPPIRPTQEDRMLHDSVLDQLQKLSPEHRAVLLLIGVEELSYRQAAEALGVPVGTVMSRLSRAREHFRQALRDPPPLRLRTVK
ncbi:RNA polymerase subunit sigma-24 [Alsobacter soli]|uniref:RNA polymerase subunit sigma-24 n=1 Tax=Alsobacter soli TaxID=2109933 RepID=A0A2T1HUI4_9HYPH|nr:RNA polymerase sigma factor [Alsobacter soli]PSC05325.1 RNA polymerase subunit sigma-24 [Alsobacter soli]